MSFLQGTTTDANDFVSQIVTWLTGLGWTVNMAPTVNGNMGGERTHLSKGSVFVNLQTGLGDTNIFSDFGVVPVFALMLYLSDSYSGAQPFLTQPGGPMDLKPMRAAVVVPLNLFSTPYGRFFAFSDASDNVVIVLERRAQNFSCFGWGPSLAKAGAWTDGRYFFSEEYRTGYGQDDSTGNLSGDCPFAVPGTGATGFVRADVDSFTGLWLANGTTSGSLSGSAGKNCYTGFGQSVPSDVPTWGRTSGMLRLAPSILNSQAVLVPVDVYAARDAGGSSLIGSIPNIFLTNAVGHGFAAATDFFIGSDDYVLFPGTTFGYAIKKV